MEKVPLFKLRYTIVKFTVNHEYPLMCKISLDHKYLFWVDIPYKVHDNLHLLNNNGNENAPFNLNNKTKASSFSIIEYIAILYVSIVSSQRSTTRI